MPRVLLSGFTPFGSFKANPSWEALKLAQERHWLAENADMKLAEIPTVYAKAFNALDAAVRSFSPQVIVSFGVHGGTAAREVGTFYLERVARNLDSSCAADNEGEKRAGKAIAEDAPAELRSEYPMEDLRDPLKRANFATEFSDNAGGFLCNHLYFRACHAYKGRIPCAFVHVPPIAGQGGVLPLEKVAEAVSIVAKHAAFLANIRGVTKGKR